MVLKKDKTIYYSAEESKKLISDTPIRLLMINWIYQSEFSNYFYYD